MLEALDSVRRLPLTVFYGALAVSGTAVPEEVFFRALGLPSWAESESRDREENRKVLTEQYEQVGRQDIPPEERLSMLEKAGYLEPQFITMVDVTILGAGPMPITAPAWRGRLSQISGWVLGTVGEHDDLATPTEADQVGTQR
jgi:hypothetical protein